MKKNIGAIYPQNQSYQTYKNEVHKILEKGMTYFEAQKANLREVPWVYDEKLQGKVNFPSVVHSFSIYCGLHFLLEGKIDREILIKAFLDFNQQDYIKEILIKSISYISDKEKNPCSKEEIKQILAKCGKSGKIGLIKGSIYKIKRYFLENNTISDIRGGSIIIDYLNNECIEEYITDVKNKLCKECLIYSGGGNILLMVPSDSGKRVCAELESKFQHVALTVMNAFESMEIDIYDLLFDFKCITGKLNEKLKERQKNKIYDFDPEVTNLTQLKINEEIIQLEVMKERRERVCRLCDIRLGVYPDEENSGQYICPACYRKHKVGKRAKSKHSQEYKAYLAKSNLSGNPQSVQNLDDMKDEQGMIAVLYGDGNNMGNIVLNIEAPHEMMYFSDRTDQITKESVYGAIHEVMQQDERFEVLAVGGDDLFFIVPAQYAPALATEIVKRFDETFNPKGTVAKDATTMSVGICIGKYNMPIKSMFEIAQANLKKAKKVVRQQIQKYPNSQIEGTIDIVEMNGGHTLIDDAQYAGIFPMYASKLRKALEGIGAMENIKIRIYDYSHAQQTMIDDEFRLYFNYKEKQFRASNKVSTYACLKNVFGENVNLYLQKALSAKELHNVNTEDIECYPQRAEIWSDLLLLLKYRRGV